MNNLSLLENKKISVSDGTYAKKTFSIDSDLKIAYFVSNRKLYSLNFHKDEVLFLYDLSFLNLKEEDVVCSCFLLEEKLYFILFKNGQIFTYDSINKEPFEYSVSVSSFIDDAKFSHDQELFVISTNDNQMRLFNKIMVLQATYDLNKTDYGVNELVNVNWGSKKTQFHGEGMRDKREAKEEYFPLKTWDDSKSCLDWRGDDNYFVVNFVCSKGFRVLKLFDRKGVLQHTSEYITGLEKCIAWKPSGYLIAASQILPNKHSIIFFEKNGLKHGEFDLSYSPDSFVLTKIEWSRDSEVLLVSGYEIDMSLNTCSEKRQNILLFTQSNYHWYQKQKITLDFPEIEEIFWDEQSYLRLHMISSNGIYYSNLYNRTLNTTDKGIVFVIDGNSLHLSDYDQTLIPPPMCNYTITFEDQIVQLCHSDNLLAVYLNEGQLIVFNTVSVTLAECTIPNYPVSYNFSNVFSDIVGIYMPVFCKKIEKISEIVLPVLFEDGRIFGIIDKKIVSIDYKKSEEICWLADINESISALAIQSNSELSLASVNGQLYCYNIEGNLCQESTLSGPNMLYDDSPIRLLVHTDNSHQSHIIALTSRCSLYYDHCLVMSSNVNSVFLYHNKYLLFTTLDSLFYCWPLHNFDPFKLTKTHPPRNVEKGSKIITTSYSQAKIVLQLPRGNLEAFYPRTLILNQVEQYLDKANFFSAFEILRKNRINFNYICDYNFTQFTENVCFFLEQLSNNTDWICLFLSELSSENSYCSLNNLPEIKIKNKVNIVCELFLEKMCQMDRIKFLNPILLTYIKREIPQIEKALQVVKDLPNSKLRDSAIKFLLYVVNVNKLFDEALGTYDFDILLMVAAKSNKDPKEYLPMVNAFKEIQDEEYRKYKIDIHLQRFHSALNHLSNCTERYKEALELIEERRLFREAVEIYKLNSSPEISTKYKEIWNLYGDYLFKKKYYKEAATAFKRAANFTQAFKMYLIYSDWNMATVCARKISQNEEEFLKLIRSVSQQLILNNHFVEGAYIQEQFLKNFKEAFLTLVKGHQWEQAIRCFHDHNLEQILYDTELKGELVTAYETMIENIEANLKKTMQYLERLEELKKLHSLMDHSNQINKMDPDFDVYSDTSSVFDSSSVKSGETNLSRSSLKTNKTNTQKKNIKRLEQRKYILKKGSPNEDIQIVFALKELFSSSENIFGECGSLIFTLYELFLTEYSYNLQQKLGLLHSQLTLAIDSVWNSEYFSGRLANDELLRTVPKISDSSKWNFALQ